MHLVRRLLTYLPSTSYIIYYLQVAAQWFQGNVTVSRGNTTIRLSSLAIQEGYDAHHVLFQKLVSLIEVIFHGLGGGAERLTTVASLSANQLRLAGDNNLYFYATHKKVSSVKSPPKQACKHKIPPSLFPIYLLFRQIVIALGMDNTSAVIPNIDRRTVLMKHVLCKIFGISYRVVSATDIRHLYASATNIVHGNNPIALTADDEGARANNHSSRVHVNWYSTSLRGGQEGRYSAYHDFFGESAIQKELNSQITRLPISTEEIRRALRIMFGPIAEFNGPEQEQMVRYSCSSNDRHKFYGLQCGMGKTLSLL